jgi:hypothetical protein
MILHAIHADKTFGESGIKGRIIVKSPHTDFLILCIHYFPSMQHTQELWFHTGSITTTKDWRMRRFNNDPTFDSTFTERFVGMDSM